MLLQQACFPQIKADSSMTHTGLQAWGGVGPEMLGRFVGPLRKEEYSASPIRPIWPGSRDSGEDRSLRQPYPMLFAVVSAQSSRV